MDTILQTPVAQADDIIKLELLLTEAIVFFQSIQNLEDHGLENTADVTNELQSKITEAQANAKKGIKAQKWNTVCLELPHSSLKMVANSMVLHLKRLDRHIPALAIASAINERLTDLMSGARLLDSVTSGNAQRFHMFSEAVRRQTFEQWPHMDYKWALPDQMAQAGFYHQPSVTGDDRAMCFTCSVCLVCWEKTDEPWSEHERHSPGCPFVKGEYTQNVPLAITYATSPALKSPPDANSEFTIVSNGNQGNLICTGNKTGQITIWNIERQLKSCLVFQISDEDKLIASSLSHISVDFNINLDAICTYKIDDCQIGAASSLANQKSISMSLKNKMIGTKIVCGISVPGFENNEEILKDLNENSNMVIEMNIQNQALNFKHGVPLQQQRVIDNSNIYLIVYEIIDSTSDKIPIKTKTLSNSSNKTEQNENKQKQLITNNCSDAKKSSVKNIVPEDRYDDVYMKFLPTEIDTMYENWKIGDLHENLYVNSSKLSDIDFKGYFTDSEHIDDEKDKQNKNLLKSDVGDSIASNLIKFDQSNGTDIKCKAIQCISIAPYNSYEITDIIPTCDKNYLLIVLRSTTILNVKDETAMEINDDEELLDSSKRVKLILYGIKDDGLLNEIPICSRLLDESDTPLEFCMLPTYDNNGRNLSENNHSGVFVMVCSDGSLKMITITTLKTVSEAKIENEKFVSAIYCKSLERLCGCTETGSLHFYSFYDLDADSGDDREDDVLYLPTADNSMLFGDHEMLEIEETHQEIPICDNISTSSQQTINLPSTPSVNVTILAYKPEINLNDLKLLHTLTQFDEMLTSYSAEVPGCWSELVQAHKQRRHPQQMRPGDDMHLTKTWRLHNDA